MNIQQSLNRGLNLLTVSIAGVVGFSFLPEVILEPGLLFKIDDILPVVLGITAIIWYKWRDNRYTRSSFPLVILLLDLIIKIIGLNIEAFGGGAPYIGDDLAGVVIFSVSIMFVLYKYKKTAQILKLA